MHVNSIAENVSLSLNFMGRKLRNHTVSPAAKQQAWARTSPSRSADDNSGGLSRTVRTQPLVCAQNELPGSIQELREEVQHQPCNVHNTHLDHENNVGVWKRGRTSWLRKSRIKWKSFKRWMSSEHYTEPSKNPAKDPNAASGSTRARDREDNAPAGVKIFIPYDAAKLCITQIADDMIAMKSRHLEMVQELEENFLMVSQENQERMVNKIRSYYQNKLNALKRVLKLYQENVERRSALWDENIKSLQSENERLQDEQKTLRERNRHDFSTWERERSKMMELFSSRLDQLHSHQASTLQELQMARMEMGHLQEILQSSKDPKDPETKETESSDSSAPLDDAKACLEELRESLYKREREISMLIDGSGVQNGVAPSTYARLLAAVVRQAHLVYAEVTEAKQQFDRMAEDNRKVVAEATARVMSFQNNQTNVDSAELRLLRMDQSGSPGGQVTQAALNLPSHEVLLVALECIKAGVTPILTGTVSEQDLAMLDESVKSFQDKFKNSGVQNSEVGKRVGQQLLLLQAELKQVKEENKKISEHYTAERTLRKKYYNMVEDMKGKIRVFCRIRPQTQAELARGSHTIVSCLDDYSVSVESPRGPREFQFDRIFTTENTQDDVFQETSRLIQSAVDGFNVCIFAYGQTGSGKTFTMLGDREQKNPGIIPRTFTRIFEIIQENESKFEFKQDSKSDLILTFRIRMPEVSDELPIVIHKAKGPLEFKNGHGMWPLQCSQVLASMLELYNDRLQDLFVSPAEALSKRIEIKKDKKGLVFAQGAEAKEATSAGELFALFELGSANRHIAATKMNIESSRSHLIISIMLESRNLAKGSMTFGKLNLVDLAGSERAAKTGAKDDQLKEANSINKSLSALGDVIAALAMEQAHVPYRNNKLTQLMQDSLGGNAKTLMFLNISPSDCNLDETLTSLIYASRVKAITNHAQRNMESKEIAHLKEVILRLKSGQAVEEEDLTFTQMC